MNWLFLALLMVGQAPAGSKPAVDAENYLIGKADSPVRIEVFSDFQCPSCRAFYLNTVTKLITEYAAGRKVAEFRSQENGFMGESFPPIVGYGSHGAVVHLSVDESNTGMIRPEGVLLIDSGGHYLSGTTDITRTVAVGPVSDQQKRDFTLVLKGMIGLSMAVFPEGTAGMHLDILARGPLCREGLNYGHVNTFCGGCITAMYTFLYDFLKERNEL